MAELIVIRSLRPGLWLAEQDGIRLLVRAVPEDRVPLYQAVQATPLPVPTIFYVGPDASGQQHVVVEGLLGPGSSTIGGRSWRNLASLTPMFVDNPDHLLIGLHRTVEALAWLHAGGYLHGYLTPQTIWLHPKGSVRFASLDCLQPLGQRRPCVAYSRHYVCPEQLEGRISTATDVRLLALAFAEAYLARHPLQGSSDATTMTPDSLASSDLRLRGDHVVLGLLERMGASDVTARPSTRELLEAQVTG